MVLKQLRIYRTEINVIIVFRFSLVRALLWNGLGILKEGKEYVLGENKMERAMQQTAHFFVV